MRKLLPPASPPAQTNLIWAAFDALTGCKDHYQLTPTSLSVLRALISFLPKTPRDGDLGLMVWPSNATLAERANGMDERTLRRHLGRLVEANLIARYDSANGKRFALRLRSQVVSAFGFDLSPLTRRLEELQAQAEMITAEEESLNVLRAVIRSHLSNTEMTPEVLALRRRLRTKLTREDLEAIIDQLQAPLPLPRNTLDLTATNSQFDRHQQKADEESYVLGYAENEEISVSPGAEADVALADCLEALNETLCFASEPVQNWSDLHRLGDQLAPMVGIGRELMNEARGSMGGLTAALSVLCIIQRGHQVRSPGAYLRRLSQLAKIGGISLATTVRNTLKARFTDVNHTHEQPA